jgi:hypothetical protein
MSSHCERVEVLIALSGQEHRGSSPARPQVPSRKLLLWKGGCTSSEVGKSHTGKSSAGGAMHAHARTNDDNKDDRNRE